MARRLRAGHHAVSAGGRNALTRLYFVNQCDMDMRVLFATIGTSMGHSLVISQELKRALYSFVLSLYETFEKANGSSALVSDIYSLGNRILGSAARIGTSDDGRRVIKDMVGDLRALKGLLGVARDIRMAERDLLASMIEESQRIADSISELIIHSDEVGVSIGRKQSYENSAGNVSSSSIGIPPINSASFKKAVKEVVLAPSADENPKPMLSPRQEAIMEVLKRRDKVTVGELGLLFSGRVSKKTLQRDLQEMAERSMIKKNGDRRWTAYSLG